jgi:hypothetical protein
MPRTQKRFSDEAYRAVARHLSAATGHPRKSILEKGWDIHRLGYSSQPGHEDLEYAETDIPFGLDSALRMKSKPRNFRYY